MKIRAEEPVRIEAAVSAAALADIRELFLAYAASLSFTLAHQYFDDELAALPGDYVPPRGALLLGRIDGRPRGCVALRDLGASRAEMKRLYVQPAARGHGLGRALVVEVVARARIAGHAAVRLDTIRSEHDAAIALYRELGFGDIPAYYETPIANTLFLELEL